MAWVTTELCTFILIDGMTADAEDLRTATRRVRDIEHASGVTAFAAMGGNGRFDGSKEPLRQLTDRTLS